MASASLIVSSSPPISIHQKLWALTPCIRCGRSSGRVNLYAHGGGVYGCGSSARRSWISRLLPIVLRSASAGSMSSPNSPRASRPARNRAGVTAARMLSPEQSMNCRAWMVCQV